MTHKYIYFRNVENPTIESVIYYVMIGESSKELRNLRVINTYAAINGAWFEKVSFSVSERLVQICGRFISTLDSVVFPLRSTRISSSDMVRLLMSNDMDSFENNLHVTRAEINLRSKLSTDFYLMRQGSKMKRFVLSLARKNLSPEYTDGLGHALIGFGLILVFGFISALLDAIEALHVIY